MVMGSYTSFLINVNNIQSPESQLETSAKFSEAEVISLVDACIMYPKAESVSKDVIDANIKLTYTCKDEKCNFSDALQEMKKGNPNDELQQLGVDELSQLIINTIISGDDDKFPSAGLSGYILVASGKPYMVIKNATGVNNLQSNAIITKHRYGLIDLSQVRKLFIFESKLKRQSYKDSFIKGLASGSIATSLLMGVIYYRKHIKRK